MIYAFRKKTFITEIWIKNMWYIYMKEYYSGSKNKKNIMPLAVTWMGLEAVILSEVSQTEKEKHCRMSFICGI